MQLHLSNAKSLFLQEDTKSLKDIGSWMCVLADTNACITGHIKIARFYLCRFQHGVVAIYHILVETQDFIHSVAYLTFSHGYLLLFRCMFLIKKFQVLSSSLVSCKQEHVSVEAKD